MRKTDPQKTYLSSVRWTEAEAQEALAALECSGLGLRAFAAGVGLDPQRLIRWRRQFAAAEAPAFEEVGRRDVALVVRAAPPQGDAAPLEIVLALGARRARARVVRCGRVAAAAGDRRGDGRAEPAAERSALRRYAARRRTQGRRQPDGARAQRVRARPAERPPLRLLLQTMRPRARRVLGPQRLRDVDQAPREGALPADVLHGRDACRRARSRPPSWR